VSNKSAAHTKWTNPCYS